MSHSPIADKIISILNDLKAINPIAVDMTKFKTFCDTMIIASGSSDRHVEAMSDRVQADIKTALGQTPLGVEGERDCQWVLIDYGDIVVHLFQEEAREFYDLEGMWGVKRFS